MPNLEKVRQCILIFAGIVAVVVVVLACINLTKLKPNIENVTDEIIKTTIGNMETYSEKNNTNQQYSFGRK